MYAGYAANGVVGRKYTCGGPQCRFGSVVESDRALAGRVLSQSGRRDLEQSLGVG